jgi:hypothetical protein
MTYVFERQPLNLEMVFTNHLNVYYRALLRYNDTKDDKRQRAESKSLSAHPECLLEDFLS